MSDTSEITNGSLTHYDSSHIQTRRDFMGLCKYNRDEFAERRKQEPNQECMAKIVRLIETLTDHAKAEWKLKALRAAEKGLAKPKEPKRYPIELSNGVIIRLIYETFGESTVRNSLNFLEHMGYIGRKQEKKNAVPIYWLEREYVQALLKAQAEVILAGYEFRPPSYGGAISYPDGVISDPKSVNSRPGYAYAGSESTDNNIGNTDDITYRNGNREREGVSASAPTPPALSDTVLKELPDGDAVLLGWMESGKNHRIYRRSGKPLGELIPIGADIDQALQEFLTVESAFPEPEYHCAGTEQQHLIWNCHTWCAANHGTCDDYQAAIEDGLHESPTDKMPAVPPNVTPVTYSQPVYKQGEDDDTGTLAAAHTLRPVSDPDAARASAGDARRDHAEAGNVEGASRARAVPETAETQDIAPMAETAAQIRKRVDRRADDLLALYCALMEDKVTRSKENMDAMRELAQLDRTDEEVTLVMRNILDDPDDFLARQLTPRKLATNFTARLRTVRGNQAKRNGHTSPAQEEPPRDYTGFDVYKGNGPEERAYYAAIGASLPDSYFDQ